jgi:hypothetical protein
MRTLQLIVALLVGALVFGILSRPHGKLQDRYRYEAVR